MKLFHLVAERAAPVSATELATASGASEKLIGTKKTSYVAFLSRYTTDRKCQIVRLLRPLSALHFVQEAGENTWTSTPITKAMCAPPIQAAHIHL